MATFEEVKATNFMFRCDKCKKEFNASEVVLVEAVDNIKILTPLMSFLYINKDGVVTGGGEQPSKEKGDKLLACPYCNAAHIFGFNKV